MPIPARNEYLDSMINTIQNEIYRSGTVDEEKIDKIIRDYGFCCNDINVYKENGIAMVHIEKCLKFSIPDNDTTRLV